MLVEVEFYALDKQLEQMIKKLETSKEEELDIWREAAAPVVKEIKARTPVGKVDKYLYENGEKKGPFPPGTLKNSIQVLPTVKDAVIVTSYEEDYALQGQDFSRQLFFIEYGFRNYQGRGFMRKGARAGAPGVVKEMIKGYNRLIEKTVRETK